MEERSFLCRAGLAKGLKHVRGVSLHVYICEQYVLGSHPIRQWWWNFISNPPGANVEHMVP